MNVSHDIRRGSVTTLDAEGFEIACRRLMTLVRANWLPDVFVGIRTWRSQRSYLWTIDAKVEAPRLGGHSTSESIV